MFPVRKSLKKVSRIFARSTVHGHEKPVQHKTTHGWENQTVHIYRGPEDNGFQHSLMPVIDRHLQHDDIVSFAREKIDPLMANLQGAEVLKDEEIAIEGGNPACEFVCKWTPGDEHSNYMKYVFVIRIGLGFAFSAAFNKKTIKTVSLTDVIDTILPGTYRPEPEDQCRD
jgi:hypothetical protein